MRQIADMTRKPDDWMPLHIGDYHADTVHLTREQHGAYLLLLMAYWRRGAALPADDARLAAIVKASPGEWRRLKPVIAEFFEERAGHWHQKRADKELTRANGLTQAKAEAGKKGAQMRWRKDGAAMAEPSPDKRQSDAPEPSPSPQEEDLPDWIPLVPWQAFLDMRCRIGAPLTGPGKQLLIAKLARMRGSGDIGAMLDQSTMNCWKSVFAVRQEERGGDAKESRESIRKPDGKSGRGSFADTISGAVHQRAGESLFDSGGQEIVVAAAG